MASCAHAPVLMCLSRIPTAWGLPHCSSFCNVHAHWMFYSIYTMHKNCKSLANIQWISRVHTACSYNHKLMHLRWSYRHQLLVYKLKWLRIFSSGFIKAADSHSRPGLWCDDGTVDFVLPGRDDGLMCWNPMEQKKRVHMMRLYSSLVT